MSQNPNVRWTHQSSSTVQEKRNNMLLADWSPSRCDTCWIISFFIYLQQKTLKILKGTADHQAFIKGGHSLTLGLLRGSKGRLLWEQKIRYWKNDPVSHWIYDISKHFLIEFIISIAFFSWPHLESNNPEAGCSLQCDYLVNYKWLLIWECISFSVIASQSVWGLKQIGDIMVATSTFYLKSVQLQSRDQVITTQHPQPLIVLFHCLILVKYF